MSLHLRPVVLGLCAGLLAAVVVALGPLLEALAPLLTLLVGTFVVLVWLQRGAEWSEEDERWRDAWRLVVGLVQMGALVAVGYTLGRWRCGCLGVAGIW